MFCFSITKSKHFRTYSTDIDISTFFVLIKWEKQILIFPAVQKFQFFSSIQHLPYNLCIEGSRSPVEIIIWSCNWELYCNICLSGQKEGSEGNLNVCITWLCNLTILLMEFFFYWVKYSPTMLLHIKYIQWSCSKTTFRIKQVGLYTN